jgi:hypothetical protein
MNGPDQSRSPSDTRPVPCRRRRCVHQAVDRVEGAQAKNSVRSKPCGKVITRETVRVSKNLTLMSGSAMQNKWIKRAIDCAIRAGGLIRYVVDLEPGQFDNRQLWMRPEICNLLVSGNLDPRQRELARAALRRFIVGRPPSPLSPKSAGIRRSETWATSRTEGRSSAIRGNAIQAPKA